jgi:hypothetical protein
MNISGESAKSDTLLLLPEAGAIFTQEVICFTTAIDTESISWF